MIKLDNQISVKLSIGPFDDFIETADFYNMEIKENSGGVRPIVNMSFSVNRDDILPYLNKGNILSLSYGINEPSSDVLQFEIEGTQISRLYSSGANVQLFASMYNRNLFEKQQSKPYVNKKSYEVIKQIATTCSMKFISNVDKTTDQQTWQQGGQTNWQFLNSIYNLAYSGPHTFYTYGFDNNNIYFYDMKKLLTQGPKWVLTACERGVADYNCPVVNIGNYKADNKNAGVMSRLVGRNRTTHVYNVDTGESLEPKYNLHTFCTMDTNKLNVSAKGCIEHEYRITTGETHEHDITAQCQNNRNNLLFSSYAVYVPVVGQYRDFRLLDIVQFFPPDNDAQCAGIYIITGICRQIKDNKLQVNLVLNRESANSIQGDTLI